MILEDKRKSLIFFLGVRVFPALAAIRDNIYPFVERPECPELLVAPHGKSDLEPVVEIDTATILQPHRDLKIIPRIDTTVHPRLLECFFAERSIAAERVVEGPAVI